MIAVVGASLALALAFGLIVRYAPEEAAHLQRRAGLHPGYVRRPRGLCVSPSVAEMEDDRPIRSTNRG
jgi:hypothetical protein